MKNVTRRVHPKCTGSNVNEARQIKTSPRNINLIIPFLWKQDGTLLITPASIYVYIYIYRERERGRERECERWRDRERERKKERETSTWNDRERDIEGESSSSSQKCIRISRSQLICKIRPYSVKIKLNAQYVRTGFQTNFGRNKPTIKTSRLHIEQC